MDSCPDLAVIDEKSLDKKDWKVIGSGGFGQVYGVRHLQWRRDVAIKVLGLDDGSSDENLDRESKLMRWAASHHVIQVLGVFRGRLPSVSDIQIGLVMELMERGSLASLQTKLNHPLPWSLVFRLAHQVALGMKHLHSLKPPIIHKDLKPGNVLLDTDLNVKITDFGLSKFVNYSTTANSKGAGTPSYMPPEALISLSYKATPAFDVYSYGILLCSIVKGKEPYDTLPAIIEFLVPQGQRPSLEVDPKQATGLEDLVKLMERCWDQEPDKRPLFPECTAETEALYEKHEPGIMDAVHQVLTELFPPPSLQDQRESVRKPEIIPEGIRKINRDDLTFDLPITPIMKTDISEVHKGEYKKHPVAIKRYLCPQTTILGEVMKIFENEVETMTRYESPHILRMFGVCFQDAGGLIVMEYCEKGSLREVLDNSKLKLPWTRKARMCLDAAQGIYKLHQSEQKSMVHGSITSDKFMVDQGYRVKLGCLELAQTETSLRRSPEGPKKSSLRYRSPEQLEDVNHPYCKICEIYSLGMVLWEIATRMKPFADCTTVQHIHKRVCEEKRVEPLPEDCPKKLAQLINACRGYDPLERPTAGVLVDKLRQVVEQFEEE